MQSNSSQRVAVGRVYGDYSELESAISEFTGIKSDRVQVPGLAGPNELVQILASIEGWKSIAYTVALIYGTGIVAEAGKDTWRSLAPRLMAAPAALRDKFLRLVDALVSEQENNQDVGIGLIEPTFDGSQRRDRIYLTDLSPEEVARHFFIFGHCAEPLAEWITSQYAKYTDLYYILMEVKITNDGHLIAILNVRNPENVNELRVVSATFDSQGKLIDNSSF